MSGPGITARQSRDLLTHVLMMPTLNFDTARLQYVKSKTSHKLGLRLTDPCLGCYTVCQSRNFIPGCLR